MVYHSRRWFLTVLNFARNSPETKAKAIYIVLLILSPFKIAEHRAKLYVIAGWCFPIPFLVSFVSIVCKQNSGLGYCTQPINLCFSYILIFAIGFETTVIRLISVGLIHCLPRNHCLMIHYSLRVRHVHKIVLCKICFVCKMVIQPVLHVPKQSQFSKWWNI